MWIILRCEGKKARFIAEEIGGYRPVVRRMTKPARKKQPVESQVPVFPGWVFWEFDEDRYSSVLQMSGVHGSMKYGRLGTMTLDNDDIERVKEIEAKLEEEARQHHDIGEDGELLGIRWCKGDRVKVPILERYGEIVAFKGDWAVVLVDEMNQEVRVHTARLEKE